MGRPLLKEEHGTQRGYRRHIYKKTKPCEPCRIAGSKYNKEKHNPVKRKKRQKIYYSKNPGLSAMYDRKRRAKLFNNGIEPYTVLEVLETYGNICHICGNNIDLKLPRQVGKPGWQLGLHIDHLISITNGGPDSLTNVRPSHGICNLSKGSI